MDRMGWISEKREGQEGPEIQSDQIKIADITFDSDPGPLRVGVQIWATTARFDNLAVIPSAPVEDAAATPSPENR